MYNHSNIYYLPTFFHDRRLAMTSRIISATVISTLLLFTFTGHLRAQYEKSNDPDTPKIRASFTVVPETDDIGELREFIVNSRKNWSDQMMHRYKELQKLLPQTER